MLEAILLIKDWFKVFLILILSYKIKAKYRNLKDACPLKNQNRQKMLKSQKEFQFS
jgi:hypothetical protein